MTIEWVPSNIVWTRNSWRSHPTSSFGKRARFTTVHRGLPITLHSNSLLSILTTLKLCKSKTSKKCSMPRTPSILIYKRRQVPMPSSIQDDRPNTERNRRTNWRSTSCQNMQLKDGWTRVSTNRQRARKSCLEASTKTRSLSWSLSNADSPTTSWPRRRTWRMLLRTSRTRHWKARYRRNSPKCNKRKNWNESCKVRRVSRMQPRALSNLRKCKNTRKHGVCWIKMSMRPLQAPPHS